MTMVETTEDALLDGRIRIRQPARGYRVNADTILLAAAFDPQKSWKGRRFVEAGCGVGAGLLALAKAHEGVSASVVLIGIERDAASAALARENVAANGAAIEIIEGDALAPEWGAGPVDAVLFNPPYDDPKTGRLPAAERMHAHIAQRPVADWIKVWCNRLTGDGHLTLIHRAERLPEILAAMEGRLGGVQMYPIRPTADAPARRVIVRAHKGSRAPLRLLRGLDLHPSDGAGAKHTPEAEALLRGDAFIDFG